MLRWVVSLVFALFACMVAGCGGNAGNDSYDGSVGREFRQSQAETYNRQQSIHGTGKAVSVPLY